MDALERRFAPASLEGRQLIGLAAPYDSETRIGDFRERIAPGAFRKTLAENRAILALRAPDPGQVLGRNNSGTLPCDETVDCLQSLFQQPATAFGQDLWPNELSAT